MYRLGVDIGSTTAKAVLVNDKKEIVYSEYLRHNADVKGTLLTILERIKEKTDSKAEIEIIITGSAGFGISERLNVPFIQEVIAVSNFVKHFAMDINTIIDIGGEDSKIIFFSKTSSLPVMRMNGNCAGGTGAFIDQMALILGVSVDELDVLAQNSKHIYPIASRCGVFSKTDVQNLVARGVSKEDIAVSIFNAIALQVVSSLSKGMQINPKILFCGGPLTYIKSLREAFARVLELEEKDFVKLENSNLIPAMGCVFTDGEQGLVIKIEDLIEKLSNTQTTTNNISNRLEVIFKDEEELQEWREEKAKGEKVGELKDFRGDCFLGLDSGSTTTKLVLTDSESNIIFSDYSRNGGNALKAVEQAIERMMQACKENNASINIVAACSTGYGEELIKTAFSMECSVVETIAHYKAAKTLCPNVDFILDIGGQDMKALFIEDGVLNKIELNEACSSGCGSFIENFANSLSYPVAEFAQIACLAKNPCDLGTRCTVFMNSKVKQSLREGASVADISAGLSYSVVKNCLYKVLKLNSLDIGKNIVVQGGTMRNDSIVKALENMVGVKVYRSQTPELMGAYGCAIHAKEKYDNNSLKTTFTSKVSDFTSKEINCKGCENKCLVTKYTFENNKTYHSGNKCEKIFSSKAEEEKGDNIYTYKLERVFENKKISNPKYRLGVPRVLNMFEDFPFWEALFSEFDIELVLSDLSTYSNYEKGLKQVMSENICFPAKLVHSHIDNLVAKGLKHIFFPYVVFEKKESENVANSYNCPIVSSYSVLIKSQLSVYDNTDIKIDNPVFTFKNKNLLFKNCEIYFKTLSNEVKSFKYSKAQLKKAFEKALQAQHQYEIDLQNKTKEYFEKAKANKQPIILLAARPYHTDSLIQHKLSDIISSLGACVISDDIVRVDNDFDMQDTYMLSQWTYMNRIVKAAKWVCEQNDEVNYAQITSFGCGPDAFLLDEITHLLKRNNKSCTIIKVDDINNVGSMRLRIRSLLESLKQKTVNTKTVEAFVDTKIFDTEDKERTILAPFFTDYASPLLPEVFALSGYKLEVLPLSDQKSADLGLQYSNNEVCYPATLIVGDMIKALSSGKYDLSKTAVGITQTGGQCRASNYYAVIRKALVDAGFSQVPVISATMSSNVHTNQPGFKLDYKSIIVIAFDAMLFGDCLSKIYHSTAVRIKNPNLALELKNQYLERAKPIVLKKDRKALIALLKEAVKEFNSLLPSEYIERKKVGIVGEIFLKFHPFANQNIISWLMSQKIEVIPPTLTPFMTQFFVNRDAKLENYLDTSSIPNPIMKLIYKIVKSEISRFNSIMSKFRYYSPLEDIYELADDVKNVIPLVAQFGEGWALPAEIVSLAKNKADGVISLQPFGCIANHIISKGVENKIKQLYPNLSLLSLDFDSGVSEVNVVNRLMLLKDTISKKH
jgi:predicted CoA-substrate-specific enzyme activase